MILEGFGMAACAAGLMTYGVRGRSSAWFGPSVYRGTGARRSIALTFDDGPSPSTPELLEILDRHAVKATFFQCGSNAGRLAAAAREVSRAGHEIGNHSETHARWWLRSPRFIFDELLRAQETLAAIHGQPPRLFRAPYGVRWFGLRQAQQRLGLLGVMWTAIGRDWALPAEAVHCRLLRRAAAGAIFCLHDGRELQPQPDVRSTLEAVRRLIPDLRDQGYRFETVSEILRPDA